jgi:tRNA1Val (adenine37-N6)-methyltransferase
MKIYQPFRFKQFQIHQNKTTMKVGTDGVLIGAWADVNEAENILDVGTGTGLIALMAAQRNELTKIDAVEIDEMAYEEAKQNFEESIWAERLKIHHVSIQDFSKNAVLQYDCIISNPPFFLNSTKPVSNEKTIARHTESLTFESLLNSVDILLKPAGKFCLILPYSEANIFEVFAKTKSLFCTRKVLVKGRDSKPFERVLMQFERKEKPIDEQFLIIQNSPKRHDYTADYLELTKDFYLFV